MNNNIFIIKMAINIIKEINCAIINIKYNKSKTSIIKRKIMVSCSQSIDSIHIIKIINKLKIMEIITEIQVI